MTGLRARSFATKAVLLFAGGGLLLLAGCPRNLPPDAPAIPSGPQAGLKDSLYRYISSAVDPDRDEVSLRFAWGDGETTDWSDPQLSGASVLDTHSWGIPGTYAVRTQAQDVFDNESPWSDVLSVAITERPNAAPGLPELSGPSSSRERYEVSYAARVDDADGDSVQIRFAWGDGDTTGWSGWVAPGEEVTASQVWTERGQYLVRAQARDVIGAEGDWSEGISVQVYAGYPHRRIGAFAVGAGPRAAVLSPDGQYLYVVLSASNAVSVVRVADSAEVARVQVGHTPFYLALLPDGKYLYVSNAYSNDVTVIRTDDHSVVATIPVGRFPYGIAALPDGRRVYVANRESDYVSVIDTELNRVTGAVYVGYRPDQVVAHPNGEYVYASLSWFAPARIAVIRTADDSVVAEPQTGRYARGLAVSPDGQYLYAACNTSIVVIRTSDYEVVEHIPVEEEYGAYELGFLPSGEYLYVTCYGEFQTLVYRVSDHALVDSISVPGISTGLAIARDGARVYVTHVSSDSVSVFGY